MASPSSSNNNNNNFASFPIPLTESLFGSAWNNSWLPHPTRDVQSSLYPWTEDAARDFVLQTALALCCGARPSPNAASFNLAQLTPANGQPAPLAPGQSPVAFYYASETPSAKQKTQEEGLLKMFMLELIESKNQQFQDQQQKEQATTATLSQDGETQAIIIIKDDVVSNTSMPNPTKKILRRKLPPKLSTKDICQGLLPSAFWMNCNMLHPIAVSCAWRIAFAVELLDDQFQEAQDLVRRELFSRNEYDWSSSPQGEQQEQEEEEGKTNTEVPGNEASNKSTNVAQDCEASFLKTNSSLKSEEAEENVFSKTKNNESNEDDDASSTPNSIWKTIYESALEDRSMAATHIRGIISRKLTLDRFSVRELHFIWQIFCGPRSTALRWFRKWNKQHIISSSSSEVNNINNNQSQNSSSGGGQTPSSFLKDKGTASSSASPATSNNLGTSSSALLLHHLPSNITLNYCSSCFPPHVNFLFTPLALHCVVKKDSLMFELRALYFGVLEQHGIGKERRVIGNANNNNIPTATETQNANNLDLTSPSSKHQSNVDDAGKDDKNSDEGALFVVPTTTTKTVKMTGKVAKNSAKQLVSFADEKTKRLSDENEDDNAVRSETTSKTNRSSNNKNNAAATEEVIATAKNQAPARRTRGGKTASALLQEVDDSDEQEEEISGKGNSKSQRNLPRKKLTAASGSELQKAIVAAASNNNSESAKYSATTPTIINVPSIKNAVPQLTTSYGFFFNSTKNPLQPFYDPQQQQPNSNNNSINQSKNQNGNNYSLRSQRTQQQQQLFQNNGDDFSGNAGDGSSQHQSQKQKPEMDLSSASETNNIFHQDHNRNDARNIFISPGLQQQSHHDDDENTNNSSNHKISQNQPITQIAAPPLIDENNVPRNNGQLGSIGATAAPRHTSAVWQLVNVAKNENNSPPDMWKEYYSRCFDLIAQSGLKMKNQEYMSKVL